MKSLTIHQPGPRSLNADTQRARETVVLTAAAIGLLRSRAARQLGICDRTVRRYQLSAMARLGAVSLTHAVALAVANGELDRSRLLNRTLPAWPAVFAPREGRLMSIVGRSYLDPGDNLSGRRTPPEPVTVVTGWNGRHPPPGPDWLIWHKPPKQTAPRNVLVEREDGIREVIPFPRRLRRTPDGTIA